MDATKMYWIRSLAGRFYSTVEDATTKEKGDAAKMLKYLSGLNPKTTDMDKQEYYAALDDNAQMSEVVKYFRKKGAMPSAEAEKASTKKYKPMKATKKFTTKTSTAKSKSQKAKDLIASSKKRKEQK